MDVLTNILIGISGIGWTTVYIVIIYRGFKDKASGMPLIALGLNIAWEFLFSVVFPSPRPIQQVANMVWFCFDVVIVVQKFMYGKKEFRRSTPGLSDRLFTVNGVAALVFSFGVVYVSALDWDDPNGKYSAYIMNAIMSFAFISMLQRSEGLEGQSIYVALGKFLGTLSPTILATLEWAQTGEYRTLPFLGLVCFFYDIAYIVLIVRRYRQMGLTVFTRRPVAGAEHRPASRDTMVSAVAPDAPGPRGTEQEEAEPAGPALVDQSIREERAHE